MVTPTRSSGACWRRTGSCRFPFRRLLSSITLPPIREVMMASTPVLFMSPTILLVLPFEKKLPAIEGWSYLQPEIKDYLGLTTEVTDALKPSTAGRVFVQQHVHSDGNVGLEAFAIRLTAALFPLHHSHTHIFYRSTLIRQVFVRIREVPFYRLRLNQGEIDRVVETLRSGWLTTGKIAHEFEQEFADYVGAKHALAVNSCTAALHLSLLASGIGSGDEVITTPIHFRRDY